MEANALAAVRVVVVAHDDELRTAMIDALRTEPDVEVVAWAEAVRHLLLLGTRADLCVCAATPRAADVSALRDRGCAVVTAGTAGDAVTVVREAAASLAHRGRPRRPSLADRQREVLVAYVTGSHLLPAVARDLSMGPETLKTHLRRIRAKYAEVGRSAPTRHDLFLRAVEDGIVSPPSGRP